MTKGNVQKMSRRLKAIADPTRIKIITLLSERPCCVCELTQVLGLAQPTISRHLRQLETEGFISGKREKAWIIYSLTPQEECCRQLLDILIKRACQDDEVLSLIEKLKKVKRPAPSESFVSATMIESSK